MKITSLTLSAIFFFTGTACAGPPPTESPTLQQIKQRGELRVGFDLGYMPFEMRNKTGEIVGFDVDLARVLARKLGVKATLVNIAWDGIIPALLTDKFDVLMGGMTITPERAERVDFCDPYMEVGQTVLISRKLAERVKTYSELNDPKFKLVTKLGTTGDIATRKMLSRAEIRSFEAESDAAMEVRNGRADGFIYDSTFNLVFAAQNKDSVVNLMPPFTQEPLGWAVRKNDPTFRLWLNQALAEMKTNGTYQALYRKWFESDAWLANVN
jgi:polar amino acid transport system substrate-binding protein